MILSLLIEQALYLLHVLVAATGEVDHDDLVFTGDHDQVVSVGTPEDDAAEHRRRIDAQVTEDAAGGHEAIGKAHLSPFYGTDLEDIFEGDLQGRQGSFYIDRVIRYRIINGM